MVCELAIVAASVVGTEYTESTTASPDMVRTTSAAIDSWPSFAAAATCCCMSCATDAQNEGEVRDAYFGFFGGSERHAPI